MIMRVAIIGTRGVPNHYGGFEQFAEYLGKGLVERGHKVTVYNSHTHPHQEKIWKGVEIIHCYDPEERLGTAGQFIYDLNCIMDSRSRNFDIILQLGYTSSSIWGWLLPRKRSIVTTNMDGLEWKRSKYSRPVRWFLKKAEYLGTVFSDYLIADSLGIQKYLVNEYRKSSIYIPYGTHIFETPESKFLRNYDVEKGCYNMLVARLEPENNIDTILEGASLAKVNMPFLVIGKHETSYGEYLKKKYSPFPNIRFCGGIYDINDLDNLRYYSNLYFHGHSVGGTNPSLLEAMGSQAFICAHNNIFNATILEEDAIYFEDAEEVKLHIENTSSKRLPSAVQNNVDKIKKLYTWDIIIDKYENHFKEIINKRGHENTGNQP